MNKMGIEERLIRMQGITILY